MDNPVVIGTYRLSKTLGIGAFGKVKLAEHVTTGHKVAVKILNRAKIVALDMSEKVKREIRRLAIKLSLTALAEDIPQFAFNTKHFKLKLDRKEVITDWDLFFLLKSAIMLGFTLTQLRLVHEKLGRKTELERRVEHIKARKERRASLTIVPNES